MSNNSELVTFKLFKYPFFRFISWMIIYGAIYGLIAGLFIGLFKSLFFQRIIYPYNSILLERVDNMILVGKYIIFSILIFVIIFIIIIYKSLKKVLFIPYIYINLKPKIRKISYIVPFILLGINKIFMIIAFLITMLFIDHVWILKAVHYFHYGNIISFQNILKQMIVKYGFNFLILSIIIFYFSLKITILRYVNITKKY